MASASRSPLAEGSFRWLFHRLHRVLRHDVRPHLRSRGGPAVKRPAAGTWRLVPDVLRPDPQDRWAAVFGRAAGYSFAVAVFSGILLLPFFRPSMATVAYQASTASWTAFR